MARPHHHHHLKLLKINGSITIAINTTNHPAALGEGALLAEALHDGVEFFGGDETITVDIEDGECVLEILKDLVGVDALGVELDEFLKVDAAVAVAVEFADHVVELLISGALAEASHDGSEFRGGDLAVAIDVEFAEDLF